MKARNYFVPALIAICLAPIPCVSRSPAEPSSISIVTISFEGNKSMSAQQIRRLLRVSFEGNEYAAEDLNADLQRVQKAYQDEGFLQAKIGPPEVRIQTLGSGQGADIRIPIIEGSRFSMGNVSAKNVQSLAPESLIQICPVQKGQPYSRFRISSWRSKIEETYRTMGYIRARCAVQEDLDEKNKIVNPTLECSEGKRYNVGKITLIADESIDRLQFKRYLLLVEGGVFDPEMLDTSIQYLNRMRLYKPIFGSDIEIRIDDERGVVDLAWHLSLLKR